jgi:putative transposase
MRHTRVGIFVHAIWTTWDRLPLVTEEIERQVYRAIEAKCAELGVEIIALGGMPDHVHMLIQLPATESIAHVIKEVKGTSAHLVAHKLTPNDFFRWQGSYAAFSVGLDGIEAVHQYILHQKEHHAAQTLVPDWEYPTDDPTAP